MPNVFEHAAAALACTDIERKQALTSALHSDWLQGRLDTTPLVLEVEGGRPAKPELVAPDQLPKRVINSAEGRAAMIHAIAHIEFNAINLALDHIVRFPQFSHEYISDWIKVAAEEAGHFALVHAHLRSLGYAYGDFTAHDGLWHMSMRTAHDPLARMALVPRLLEARGLDATPKMQKRLAAAGDHAAVSILDIILHDEVSHVAIGDRWFRALCAERGVEPEATYRHLLIEYAAPWPQAPFNEKARRAAGFSDAEMQAFSHKGITAAHKVP